jgi:predicted amino acid-binding ACT domain protein
MDKKIVELTEKFSKERKKLSNEILENIQKLNSLKTLKEAQVNILSIRQRVLEDMHTLLDNLTNIRKDYRQKRSTSLENLSKNLQLRYQANEKTVIVDGELSVSKQLIDIFENQISFYTETIKTVDNVIYGIKTRIDIDKTLGL